MRLLPIAIVASWLAQSVVAEVPNKYLSVGLLSVVCQNDAQKADEDFYVFSKEGDSWTSIVGNVTSIHETAEGFTLKLSNSPHETSFLKRTNEGYNLVSFKKGETSKKSHIFYFPDFLRMIEEGQILVGPAILLGFWLAQNRDKLREVT